MVQRLGIAFQGVLARGVRRWLRPALPQSPRDDYDRIRALIAEWDDADEDGVPDLGRMERSMLAGHLTANGVELVRASGASGGASSDG